MSKKLPLCAYCGKPLAYSCGGRVLEQIPTPFGGRETYLIGWHRLCWEKDELNSTRSHWADTSIIPKINQRGSGRVK